MRPPAEIKRWASATAGAFASCGGSESGSEDGRVRCWGCDDTDGYKFAHGQSDAPASLALNASSVATGAYSLVFHRSRHRSAKYRPHRSDHASSRTTTKAASHPQCDGCRLL
jgi:hypothetical protein